MLALAVNDIVQIKMLDKNGQMLGSVRQDLELSVCDDPYY